MISNIQVKSTIKGIFVYVNGSAVSKHRSVNFAQRAADVLAEVIQKERRDAYENGLDEGSDPNGTYDDGYEDGWEDGYQAGLDDGYSNGRDECDECEECPEPLQVTQHSPHTGANEKVLAKDVESVQIPEGTTLVIRHTDGKEEMFNAPKHAITLVWSQN